MFSLPGSTRRPTTSRVTMRWLRRQRKAHEYAIKQLEGGGEREKARRVRNMVRETLRAENGVVQQFEDTSDRISPEQLEAYRKEIEEIEEANK